MSREDLPISRLSSPKQDLTSDDLFIITQYTSTGFRSAKVSLGQISEFIFSNGEALAAAGFLDKVHRLQTNSFLLGKGTLSDPLRVDTMRLATQFVSTGTRILPGQGIEVSGGGIIGQEGGVTVSAKLVDNLTTNDDTRGLTAKQGKALYDLIMSGGLGGFGISNKVVVVPPTGSTTSTYTVNCTKTTLVLLGTNFTASASKNVNKLEIKTTTSTGVIDIVEDFIAGNINTELKNFFARPRSYSFLVQAGGSFTVTLEVPNVVDAPNVSTWYRLMELGADGSIIITPPDPENPGGGDGGDPGGSTNPPDPTDTSVVGTEINWGEYGGTTNVPGWNNDQSTYGYGLINFQNCRYIYPSDPSKVNSTGTKANYRAGLLVKNRYGVVQVSEPFLAMDCGHYTPVLFNGSNNAVVSGGYGYKVVSSHPDITQYTSDVAFGGGSAKNQSFSFGTTWLTRTSLTTAQKIVKFGWAAINTGQDLFQASIPISGKRVEPPATLTTAHAHLKWTYLGNQRFGFQVRLKNCRQFVGKTFNVTVSVGGNSTVENNTVVGVNTSPWTSIKIMTYTFPITLQRGEGYLKSSAVEAEGDYFCVVKRATPGNGNASFSNTLTGDINLKDVEIFIDELDQRIY